MLYVDFAVKANQLTQHGKKVSVCWQCSVQGELPAASLRDDHRAVDEVVVAPFANWDTLIQVA